MVNASSSRILERACHKLIALVLLGAILVCSAADISRQRSKTIQHRSPSVAPAVSTTTTRQIPTSFSSYTDGDEDTGDKHVDYELY